MNAKSIAAWLGIALLVWWEIENPHSAAHIVQHIGSFLSSAATGITNFFAPI